MAVVQGTGTGQKIQVLLAIFGIKMCVLGAVEDDRKRTAVYTYFGFSRLENFHGLAS